MIVPAVAFDHLVRLSDGVGLFEHAEYTTPRTAHGYCVDDVARGLLVLARQPQPGELMLDLASVYLRFIAAAQHHDGGFRNRCGPDLDWQGEPVFDDCWGRALWGLGTTVARLPALSGRALALFDLSVVRRTRSPRAMAFAGLGAAEVLHLHPGHEDAAALLADAAKTIGSPGVQADWCWPEPRLHYANAALPDALLAAGSLLKDPGVLADGLAMLDWLYRIEGLADRLSVTPVGGWATGEPRPAFDQQPIEVAALADACARAFDITGDPIWSAAVTRCAAWFLGENDSQVPLYDPLSTGGCDGLERAGRNENQGAESTLAALSTFQQVHRLALPS